MKLDEILARRLPDFCRLLFIAAVTIGALVGGIWAALGIGGALIMFLAVWRIEKRLPLPRTDLAALTLVMLATCALLNLQSAWPQASWIMWARLVTIFLPLMLLSSKHMQVRAAPEDLFTLLPWCAALGGFALSLELALGGPLLHALRGAHPLTWYNRGISYVAVLALPIMAALWTSNPPKRREWTALFVLALLVPLAFTESRAAKMAFALALGVTLLAALAPVLMRRFLALVIVLLPIWPFAVQKFFLARHDLVLRLPISWHDRVDIWDNMSYRILEHPWLGWGLTASRFVPCAEPHGALYVRAPACPGHPHNAIIQLWVELGIPGLVFGIAFALLVLHWIERLDRRLAPFALGAFTGALTLSLVAYDLWTDSLFGAFALTAFAFALLQRRITSDSKTNHA